MKKSRLLGAVCVCVGMIGTASAATIDFQDVPSGSCNFSGTLVTSGGFDFTGNPSDPALFVCDAGVNGANTSAALIDANSLSIVTMVASNGDAFSLQSFFAGSRADEPDITQVSSFFGLATGIEAVGTLSGGGTVSTTLNFNHLDLDQFFLPSTFNNLTSVTFTALGGPIVEFLIDDIVVNEVAAVVPIPTAAWLFGSGLLGLVGMARRKKSA